VDFERGVLQGAAVVVLGLSLVGSAGAVVAPSGTAAAAGSDNPKVVISPAATSYATGQTVRVSVGPNQFFTPHVRIVILECADPKGSADHLPTSFADCDGNTINADSVIVQNDGSFTEAAYSLYALPNIELGEGPTVTPVCNPTSACVLFVGQDQNDFTQPKIFSASFTFTSVPATLAGGHGPTTVPSVVQPAPAQPASASVSLPASTLAYTGIGSGSWWLGAAGAALVLGGAFGRRNIRRWSR